MNWSDPWDIIGWGIIGYVVVITAIIVLVFAGIFTYAIIATFLQTRRVKRANAGKLKCETKGCKKRAAYRTPKGYFCAEDSRSNTRGFSRSFNTTFRFPLEYMK